MIVLCLSAFDRHEGGYGLISKRAYCVGSQSLVPQIIFYYGRVMYCFTVLCSKRKALENNCKAH